MPVPKFDEIMLPLLRVMSDGKEHTFPELVPRLADDFQLSDSERSEQLSSGQFRFRNRIYWAKLHLSQAGVISTVRPATFQITERGRDLLRRGVDRITTDILDEYPEYQAFIAKSKGKKSSNVQAEEIKEKPVTLITTNETPQDAIQNACAELETSIISGLLDEVRAASPAFLEKLMVKLLSRMGYGDGENSGVVLGGVHDGGVDGVIWKDRLRLGSVYLQAKRYKEGSSIGSPMIHEFAGSMQARRAEEGVFVTTSTFTKDAQDAVKNLRVRIALIDGKRLAELMFEYGMGTIVESTITLKRIDSDFFAEG